MSWCLWPIFNHKLTIKGGGYVHPINFSHFEEKRFMAVAPDGMLTIASISHRLISIELN